MEVKEFSSKRLKFCFPKAADANAFYENIDWSVIRNIPKAPWPFTLEHAKAFVADAEYDRKNKICYELILCDKNTNQFVGVISLKVNVTGEPPGQIGYWITQTYRGEGLAFEAVSEIIKLAKALKLKKIWALARYDNLPSIHLLKKFGMVFTEKRMGTYEGKEIPEDVYEMNF